MTKNILITGATGFVGADIMSRLLTESEENKIFLIARGKNGTAAGKRVESIITEQFGKNSKDILPRIEVFKGNITENDLGLDNKIFNRLTEETDEIYHCAAITDIVYPIDEIRKVNVKGTENVLNLALRGVKAKKLNKVFHISTAYVVGTKKCLFKEDNLKLGQDFHNTYEQSKYEAELLVDQYREKGINITVFRPSMITGDSRTGKTSNFKMFYKPLHFLAEEIFDAIPADKGCFDNFVPIDKVAEAIYLIANDKETDKKRYHLVHQNEMNIEHFVSAASDFFGFKKPEFIPFEDFDINSLTPVQKRIIEPYIPYFHYETKFDSSNADKILKKYNFSYPDYDKKLLNAIFSYCEKIGFIKRKRKTYVTKG